MENRKSSPNENMVRDYKIIIIGDSLVGKTSIIQRYVNNQFQDQEPTIGVDYHKKVISLESSKMPDSFKGSMNDDAHLDKIMENIKLSLHDTAGQERFRNVTRSYYRNADAVLIVYDITDANSFKSLKEWLNEIK